MGMLQSDVRQDYLQVFLADLDKVDRASLDAGFAELETRAREALGREGFAAGSAAIEREIDLRYDGQQWPVRVALTARRFDAAAARQAFEAEHQRLFGHIQPGGRIDITALARRRPRPARLDAARPRVRRRPRRPRPRETAQGLDRSRRMAGATCRSTTAPSCGRAAQLDGPLLIEERTTTAFIGPRDRLEVDARDDFLVPRRSRSHEHRCTLDPVTLALVQNRLDHISHQMGWVMTRTARSPIFSQSHDFSCFIADARGTLISQADGIPIHTGGGGFAVRAILRDFTDAIEPEDVFLLNDPYVAGGNHLPDWVIARPVFVARRAGRLRLQPRPSGRHRRRCGRHLQSRRPPRSSTRASACRC